MSTTTPLKIGDRVAVTDPGSEHFGRIGMIETCHFNGDTPADQYHEIIFLARADGLGTTARMPATMLRCEREEGAAREGENPACPVEPQA